MSNAIDVYVNGTVGQVILETNILRNVEIPTIDISSSWISP